MRAALVDPRVSVHRIDHGPAFRHRQRDRFLAIDILAGPRRHNRNQRARLRAGHLYPKRHWFGSEYGATNQPDPRGYQSGLRRYRRQLSHRINMS